MTKDSDYQNLLKKVIDTLEHYKFWFKKEIEEAEGKNEKQYSLLDVFKDRVDLIDRIAISMEIDIKETWDENFEDLQICFYCEDPIPPPDYVVLQRLGETYPAHFDCVKRWEEENPY